MKLTQRSLVVVFVVLAALLLLIGTVSAGTPAAETSRAASAVAAAITPIPTAAKTNLPDYTGAPVKARPLARCPCAAEPIPGAQPVQLRAQ